MLWPMPSRIVLGQLSRAGGLRPNTSRVADEGGWRMSSPSRGLYWWAREVRLAELSYFRQLAQRWRTFAEGRGSPLRPIAATASHAWKGDKGAAMRGTNTVYWTRGGVTESEFLANKTNLQPAEHHELDDALGWARNVNKNGGIAWLIACHDGTNLTRSEIEKIVRKRGRELAGRPKKRATR